MFVCLKVTIPTPFCSLTFIEGQTKKNVICGTVKTEKLSFGSCVVTTNFVAPKMDTEIYSFQLTGIHACRWILER